MTTRSDDRRRGAMNAHDLDALHEAATPAPWKVNGAKIGGGEWVDEFVCGPVYLCADAALIVALRNAYASGDLVHREKVEELKARAPIPFGTVTLDSQEVEALARDRDRWQRSAEHHKAMCEWLAREGYLLIKEAREDVMRAHDALVGYESEDAMLAAAREAMNPCDFPPDGEIPTTVK